MPTFDFSSITEVLEQWGVKSISILRKCALDDAFRRKLVMAVRDTAKRNGATLTLSAASTWISLAIGSIGIAGLGGAVGVPLAILLIPLGLLSGGFLDEDGLLSRTRKRTFSLFGIKNTEDRKETDAEIALTAQALQEIAGRVDAVSDRVEWCVPENARLNSKIDAVTQQLKRREKQLVVVGLIAVVAIAVGRYVSLHS